MGFVYENLAIRKSEFPDWWQNVVINSNLISILMCLTYHMLDYSFLFFSFIRNSWILIHSQSQLYFAMNEVKYQDTGGNGLFSPSPFFLFLTLKLLSFADTLKITSHLKIYYF